MHPLVDARSVEYLHAFKLCLLTVEPVQALSVPLKGWLLFDLKQDLPPCLEESLLLKKLLDELQSGVLHEFEQRNGGRFRFVFGLRLVFMRVNEDVLDT